MLIVQKLELATLLLYENCVFVSLMKATYSVSNMKNLLNKEIESETHFVYTKPLLYLVFVSCCNKSHFFQIFKLDTLYVRKFIHVCMPGRERLGIT